MDNYIKTLIHRMAKMTGTTLTARHQQILDFAYEYYRKHRVGPLYKNIQKFTGATRGEMEGLFPNGLASIYTWVGIPVASTEGGCKPMVPVHVENRREVYMDHNGTTPLRREVAQSLMEFQADPLNFGNPSSSTTLGKKAHDIIFKARTRVADCLEVAPQNILFTGSGSEANNMAIKGIAFRHRDTKGHIVTSKVEHSSVLRPLRFLEEQGFEVTCLDVGVDGRVSPESLLKSLKHNTILVCIMAANNEIGVINPMEELGEICRFRGIPLMVDAVQAFGKMPMNPKKLGISLLSASGHKIYAPKGVGILFIDDGVSIPSLIHGGGQEFGLRAGTENVASIMALGLASQLAHLEMMGENRRMLGLRNYFLDELKKVVPGFVLNGSLENRLPNNLNIGFPDVDSGSLLLSLDHVGITVSSGAACGSGTTEASHVIKALGVDTQRYGIVRFSFGLQTCKEDMDYLFNVLPKILDGL